MEEKERVLEERIKRYNQLIRDMSFVKLIVNGFITFLVMLFAIAISFILWGLLY